MFRKKLLPWFTQKNTFTKKMIVTTVLLAIGVPSSLAGLSALLFLDALKVFLWLGGIGWVLISGAMIVIATIQNRDWTK